MALSATIVLFDLPKMLEDILFGVLHDHPEFRVLRSQPSDASPLAAALREGASLVIVANPKPDDLPALDPELAHMAGIALLALRPDGASACLHSLRPTMSQIDDVSGAQLIAALSAAVVQGNA